MEHSLFFTPVEFTWFSRKCASNFVLLGNLKLQLLQGNLCGIAVCLLNASRDSLESLLLAQIVPHSLHVYLSSKLLERPCFSSTCSLSLISLMKVHSHCSHSSVWGVSMCSVKSFFSPAPNLFLQCSHTRRSFLLCSVATWVARP